MRKIVSRHEKQRKEKRNQWIVGIILVGVMMFSLIAGSFNGFGSGDEKVKYNGFEFVEKNGYWVLELENVDFVFRNNPEEVDRVGGNLKNVNEYSNLPLYIYSENNEAEAEIYNNLFYSNRIVQRFQKACPEDERCEGDVPVKTCENNFIIIRENNVSKIEQEENCVFIEGKRENLIKLTDEFLFKTLGIS